MNHYVQQAENFHDEMTILSQKASDDFLSQTRILPAKYCFNFNCKRKNSVRKQAWNYSSFQPHVIDENIVGTNDKQAVWRYD